MSIKTFKPTTPSRRHMTVSGFDGIDKHAKPEASLVEVLKKNAGRNSYGRITVRHRGGGEKRKYRIIDFKRDKMDMEATVLRLEYDPNRSAYIALVEYEDGERRYILAPNGLKAGHIIMTGPDADILPGNALYELKHNDRVIGGYTPESTREAMAFYSHFVSGSLHSTNSPTAEMCKLVENSSRDVQIAFANELSIICDKAGINVWELIQLANKHPRVNILQPGAGVGGHCIAVDPYFITSDFPLESQLIGKAREINNYKAFWCAEKIKNTILTYQLENKRKPKIALMGLAFKADIDDLRESPAKYIAEKIVSEFPEACLIVEPNISQHPQFQLSETGYAYRQADIIAFLVAHKEFKTLPYDNSKLILDFCGIFKK